METKLKIYCFVIILLTIISFIIINTDNEREIYVKQIELNKSNNEKPTQDFRNTIQIDSKLDFIYIED